MRQRRVRQLCFWASAGITLATVVSLCIVIGSRARWRQVENAIHQAEAAPSQATTDSLVRLLREGHPTPEQGRRMLALLFRPQVTTRRAYPPGRRPTVALQLPFKLQRSGELPRLGGGFFVEGALWADGKSTEIDFYMDVNGPYQEGAYRIVALDHPLQAGQLCEAEMRCHVRHLTPGKYNPVSGNPVVQGVVRNVVLRFNRKLAGKICNPKTKIYECDFVVPVSLVAAADGNEVKVDLVSDPQLDLCLRSDFAFYSEASMEPTYSTNAGLLSGSGGVTITYPELPLAVAFQAVLRLPDGREIALPCGFGGSLRTRAGAFGQFYIDIADFLGPAVDAGTPWIPGEYTTTLVLRPDPNLAYDDPTIDSIWGGTLEFPIQFTITAEPDSARRQPDTSEQRK
jgi:hypothetical protein